jgi:hypothetical protein
MSQCYKWHRTVFDGEAPGVTTATPAIYLGAFSGRARISPCNIDWRKQRELERS